MDARKVIESDMKDYIGKALKLGILVNPRINGEFYSNRHIISSKYTRFSNEQDYLERYYKQYENGEFLAAFSDGAFLQINYEFSVRSKNKSYLSKMNLCYLPSVVDDKVLNEYMRLDYNNSDDNSFFHSFAHLHIGFRNTIRIPVEDVTLFSEFMRIILYFYYPDQFKEIYGKDYKMTNTKDASCTCRLTEHAVLTQEIKDNCYLKII